MRVMYKNTHSPNPEKIKFQRFGISNLTKQQAAAQCGVSVRTWSAWEKGERKMPYSTWCWFVTVTEGIPLNGDWSGWRFFKGKLWSPENDGFKPGEIRALPLLHQTISAFRVNENRRARGLVTDDIAQKRHVIRGQVSMVSQLMAILFSEFEHDDDLVIRNMHRPMHDAALEVTRLQFKLLEATEVLA